MIINESKVMDQYYQVLFKYNGNYAGRGTQDYFANKKDAEDQAKYYKKKYNLNDQDIEILKFNNNKIVDKWTGTTINESSMNEDTVQKSNGKWTNRGDDGKEHGEFKTKKEADAQRKAMFANGYKG